MKKRTYLGTATLNSDGTKYTVTFADGYKKTDFAFLIIMVACGGGADLTSGYDCDEKIVHNTHPAYIYFSTFNSKNVCIGLYENYAIMLKTGSYVFEAFSVWGVQLAS